MMGIKFDKFTWVVIGIVALLIVAALVTISWNQVGMTPDYLTEDSPEAPIYNAFIAFQNSDISKAKEYYSQQVLDDSESNAGYGPLSSFRYHNLDDTRRLRIINVALNDNDPEKASVTYMVDKYRQRGLFGDSNTWSSRTTVEVIREAGAWKINSLEFFY